MLSCSGIFEESQTRKSPKDFDPESFAAVHDLFQKYSEAMFRERTVEPNHYQANGV